MAIGARERDILTQFLLEAIIISIAGCLIGLVLGIGIALLVNKLTSMVVVISAARCWWPSPSPPAWASSSALPGPQGGSPPIPLEALRYQWICLEF